MGLPSSSRGGARVIWVVLHTAEGARRRQDLYNFFNANQNSSSHVGIDGSGFDDWLGRDRSAWTLLNGNPISVNAELCGFARWTREQWLSTGTVDGVVNPRGMVRAAAQWAKRECEALGIPKVYVGTAGVRNRTSGILIHWDYSKGTGDGDHWDTGAGFPFDVFFEDMGAAGGGGGAISKAKEFPLPAGHYFGDIDGPDESHGGYDSAEQVWVAQVQEALQRTGNAPNTPGWADGMWEEATTSAMMSWERKQKRTPNGQCDKAEWDLLVRPLTSITDPAKDDRMFQSIPLPPSPVDGSTATATIALPWRPGGVNTFTKASAVIVANAAGISVRVAHFRTNKNGVRSFSKMVPDATVVAALSDSGGQAIPEYAYSLVIDYVSSTGGAVGIEIAP